MVSREGPDIYANGENHNFNNNFRNHCSTGEFNKLNLITGVPIYSIANLKANCYLYAERNLIYY